MEDKKYVINLNTECESINSESIEELFHWNQTPEDRTKTCEEDRAIKGAWNRSAIGIVEFFVTLIQDYLSDPNNIISDDIRNLIINKDVDVSAMQDFNTDTAGTLPRIIVEFGGKQAQQNFAINNKFGYNIHNSSTDYYSHWQIALSIYVIGNTINETLMLAEEVSNFCHYFQEQICAAAGFLRCQVAEVNKPQCLSESSAQRSYLSAISLSIVVADAWSVYEQAPVLKRVTFIAGPNKHF